jgi:hypothetical protein
MHIMLSVHSMHSMRSTNNTYAMRSVRRAVPRPLQRAELSVPQASSLQPSSAIC